jgi:glycosyltransferase involved in cell wall biosynthesis
MATTPSAAEHVIISIGPPGHYSPLLEQSGVEVYHLGAKTPLRGVLAMAQLVALLRKLQPAVIQSWMYRANVLAGVGGAILGIPVVWGVHCSSFKELKWQARLWVRLSGFLARRLPHTIINCSAKSVETHNPIGYDKAPVEVVFNGYDTDAFRPDEGRRAVARDALGIAERHFLIGNVSRWHDQKDLKTLIEGLRLFAPDAPADWKCILVGRGLDDGNELLKRWITAAALQNHILCLGPRTDTSDLMRALDLHVLSSAFGEAFPNVVAETMASATPNVVTDVGDSRYLVNGTGWTVPPSSPKELGAALLAAAREAQEAPDAWLSRRKAARRRVEENFTFSRMMGGYERIWMSASSGSRGDSPGQGLAS